MEEKPQWQRKPWLRELFELFDCGVGIYILCELRAWAVECEVREFLGWNQAQDAAGKGCMGLLYVIQITISPKTSFVGFVGLVTRQKKQRNKAVIS